MLDDNEFKDKFSGTQKNSSIIVNQTYSYINNTGFYALANPTYYNYYYRFVRRYAWWYDRYVPDFHNAQQGYFSTGVAHAIVDGIANQIVGRKILFKRAGEVESLQKSDSLRRAYEWGTQAQFTSKIRELTKYSGALGTSCMKSNVDSHGEIWLEALRLDDFFFKTDFKGNLTEITCLIKSYTDTQRQRVEKWADSYGENSKLELGGKYYLIEKRFYKNIKEIVKGVMTSHDVPFVVYQIHKYNGTITNAQTWNVNFQESVRFDSLPSCVKKAIINDYATVMFDKPQRLPFTDLGCDLYRYNGNDGSLSQQPFGQSILTNLISDLMEYDLAFSYSVRDMYQGKGTVFMAKELQTAASGQSAYQGLEDTLITLVNSWQADGKLPIDKVQFDLRVAEWREKRNAIYESIAMKLNISPSSLASFLSDNTARTAKEVSTESTATDNYVDIQRESLESTLNRTLKRIGNYYGWADTIEVRWAKATGQGIDQVVDRVIKLKSAGLIEPKEALRQIYIDLDESQIDAMYESLMAYNEQEYQKQSNSMFGMDYENKQNNL